MAVFRKFFALAAFGAVAWFAAGCSDTSLLPTQPAPVAEQPQPALQRVTRSASSVRILERFSQRSGSAMFVAVGLVTPRRGGVLTAGDNEYGFTTLTVPPGAVSRPRILTMLVRIKGPVEVTLAPSPMSFDVPLELAVSYRGADLGDLDEHSLKVFYDNGEWEEVPGSVPDIALKVVRTQITHFSRYAIGGND